MDISGTAQCKTIAVELQFKQLWRSPKNSFLGLQWDSNPWPLFSCCGARPAELWRPIHRRKANLFQFINPWKEWNMEWNDVNCRNKWKRKMLTYITTTVLESNDVRMGWQLYYTFSRQINSSVCWYTVQDYGNWRAVSNLSNEWF